jgi:hypothetical protein
MKITSLSFGLAILLVVSGCSTVPVTPLARPATSNQAEVIVFRESSFIGGGVSLAVGKGDAAFAKIDNSEYVQVLLPEGKHEIFVRARSAEPTKLKVSFERGARVCLRTSSSPGTVAKVIIPITLVATGYHFYLDQVPCPTTEELSKYTLVPVSYL